MVHNRYRLSGDHLKREQGNKIPRKIFWVSAEGTITERQYLEGISNFRDQLGIVSIVDVQSLERKKSEGHNKPEDVIALLEEFFHIRDVDLYEIIENINPTFFDKIPQLALKQYLQGTLSEKENKRVEDNIKLLGINLSYWNYLKKRSSDEDEFCIIIDRDKHSHNEDSIKNCISWCNENGAHLFFSNPCFEFWLLLHFKDIHNDYTTKEFESFLENKRVSKGHTFTSKTLSEVFKDLTGTGHGKSILRFEDYYLNRIENAIKKC